ncbi:hypothetical protein WJX77_001202 [Trebouxia sp. C0004]
MGGQFITWPRADSSHVSASEPAHAGHDCQAAAEAAGGDSSKVSSQGALAPAAHALATNRATAADGSASATQGAAADATERKDSVIKDNESAPPVPAVTWERSEPVLSDSALQEAAGSE